MNRILIPCLTAIAVAGCVTAPAETPAIALLTADGRQVGSIQLDQDGESIAVRARVSGLPAGVHGIHLHAVGRCEAPEFTSAGGHWNPQQRQHGTENPAGPHMGDMPNLTVGADGTGSIDFRIPGRINTGATPLLDADGASVVLHEKADDYRTDPSGNSGARIACAVLGAA